MIKNEFHNNPRLPHRLTGAKPYSEVRIREMY